MTEPRGRSRSSPARPFQVVLRAAVIVSASVAIACTRAAAAEPIIALEVAIVVVSLLCAITPDTHAGLLVVVLVGTNWLVTVDDTTTPWAIGAALAIGLFHTSMSAASVAPIAARWTRAMCRRWTRRVVVLVSVTFPVWAFVALVDGVDIGGSSVVMAGALFVIGIAGLWSRFGAMVRQPPGPAPISRP